MCVFVCICACMHTYIYLSHLPPLSHTASSAQYKPSCVCVYLYAYVPVCIHTYTYHICFLSSTQHRALSVNHCVCIYICMRMCLYAYMHTNITFESARTKPGCVCVRMRASCAYLQHYIRRHVHTYLQHVHTYLQQISNARVRIYIHTT